MAFLTDRDLRTFDFKHLGTDVRISDKASIHEPHLIEIGDHSRIDDFCVLSGRIVLGRNVHVAVFCNLAGGEPGIFLDDFAGLAYGCQVFAQSDDYSGKSMTNPTVPDAYKRETKAQVVIKRHVIIGASSVILPGVTVEEGAAVGAMSMVTKSTEPWSIYFGSPAKRIRARSKKLLDLERDYLGRAD